MVVYLVSEVNYYVNGRTSWTIYLSVQQKMEEAKREKEELVKNMGLLQQEKEQLEAEKESLQKDCEQEKETCAQLRRASQVSWERSQLLKADRSASRKEGRKTLVAVKVLSVKKKALFPFLLFSLVVLGCWLCITCC